MKAKSEEFTDEDLKAICALPNFDKSTDIRDRVDKFITVEDKSVKFWRYEHGLITTVRKINVKQKLVDAVTSDIIGFIVVLSANGKVLILDSEGEYVSSIERTDLEFSSISCSMENLYLGTMNGTVHSYSVSSLIGSSNKQISYADLLRPFEMKNNEHEDIESKFTNKVKKIHSCKSGKRVLISFKNNNFYVYNIRREAIDGVYIAQHAEEIKAIEWVSKSGKSLVTISDKLCLAKTKIADAGAWSSSTIDITEDMYSKLLHDTKNIQSDPLVKKFGKNSNSTNKISLT